MSKVKNFPSDEEIRRVMKKLRNVKGSRVLPPDAPMSLRIKFQLSEQFVIYLKKTGSSQKALARKLKVSESRVSEIVHYRVGRISIDKLIELLDRLDRKVTVSVA